LGSKAAGRKEEGKLLKEGGHAKTKSGSDMSNADIGLVHEFGSMSRGIKRRSFLLMPLQQKAEGWAAGKNMIWNKFLAGDQSVASLKQHILGWCIC